MNDRDAQAAFHYGMAKDPDDDHLRLVYADWLDDRGHNIPAERLRWWVAAKNHPAGHVSAVNYPAVYGAAPPWVDRMVSTIRAWRAIRKTGGPHHASLIPPLATSERHALNLATGDELSEAMGDAAPIGDAIYHAPGGSASEGGAAAAIAASNAVQGNHYAANQWSHIVEASHGEAPEYDWNERHSPLHQSVMRYQKEQPAKNYIAPPTKLAAIDPRPDGGVLVRVPNPSPPAQAQPPASPPHAPKTNTQGLPTFLLPQ